MFNPELTPLKAKFKLALSIANMDYKSFAEKYGFTNSYISQIMDGKLKANPEITKAIIEFTRTQMMVINQLAKEPV
jgi:hypothetical protein